MYCNTKNSKLKTLKGLCVTCNHADTCTYLNRSEGVVWHCEEFDDSGIPKPTTLNTSDPGESLVAVEENPANLADKLVGICSNCQHRFTCKLPKALDGVWHCEEYE